MNKCYLQLWEESERGWGSRPDGCSLHLTLKDRDDYINIIYKDRTLEDVPDEYDRIVGNPIECEISEALFEKLKNSNNLRLFEYEKNNLVKLNEIIHKKVNAF